MIRALYTAASGMNAQQANIDNVAHNLANVNTTGFKKSRVEFEDLVYQQLKAPGTADVAGDRSAGRSRSRPRLARRWPRRATSRCGNLRATQRPARPGDRRPGLPPGHAAGRRDRLHARRHAAPERRGSARDRRGLPLEPQITIPPNAVDRDDLEGRHRLGERSPIRTATQQVGHDRAGELPEPGRADGPRAATSSWRRPRPAIR